jgi:hypothetical protein
MGSRRVINAPSVTVAIVLAAFALGATFVAGKPEPLDTLGPGPPTQSTFTHSDGRFAAIGKSILIAQGRTPSGLGYELATYATRPPQGEAGSVGSVHKATCVDLDYPSTQQAPGTNKVCFGGKNTSVLHVSGLSEVPGSGHKAGYVLTGETLPRVAAVSVTYTRRDGERVAAPGSYGLITARVAHAADIRFRAGELVAFLPASAVHLPASPDPAGSLVPSLEVTAYGRDGEVLDKDTWGDDKRELTKGEYARALAEGLNRNASYVHGRVVTKVTCTDPLARRCHLRLAANSGDRARTKSVKAFLDPEETRAIKLPMRPDATERLQDGAVLLVNAVTREYGLLRLGIALRVHDPGAGE